MDGNFTLACVSLTWGNFQLVTVLADNGTSLCGGLVVAASPDPECPLSSRAPRTLSAVAVANKVARSGMVAKTFMLLFSNCDFSVYAIVKRREYIPCQSKLRIRINQDSRSCIMYYAR